MKGRPKGSTNARNMMLKQMILNALERVGGIEYLSKQAKENPSAFLTLIGKVLPQDVNNNHSGGIKIDSTVNVIDKP